jgi:hypothetical protein
VKKAEVDSGCKPGLTTDMAARHGITRHLLVARRQRGHQPRRFRQFQLNKDRAEVGADRGGSRDRGRWHRVVVLQSEPGKLTLPSRSSPSTTRHRILKCPPSCWNGKRSNGIGAADWRAA